MILVENRQPVDESVDRVPGWRSSPTLIAPEAATSPWLVGHGWEWLGMVHQLYSYTIVVNQHQYGYTNCVISASYAEQISSTWLMFLRTSSNYWGPKPM